MSSDPRSVALTLGIILALSAACGGRADVRDAQERGGPGTSGTDRDTGTAEGDNDGAAASANAQPDAIADVTLEILDDAPVDSAPPGANCDVLAQDCAGPNGKCSLVSAPDDGGFPSLVAVCVNDGGSKGEGEMCTLQGAGPGTWSSPSAVGHDDCRAGFFCAVAGLWGDAIRKTGYCRALCRSNAQCPAAESCVEGLFCDGPADG
jgi:hypothetical protein